MKLVIGIGCIDPRLFDCGLSSTSLATFFAILAHADANSGECYPSVRTLAAKIRANKNTITACLRELAEAGIIRVQKRVRTTSNIKVLPAINWKLSQNEAFTAQKSVPNEGTGNRKTVPIESRVTKDSDPDVSAFTATTNNNGKHYERDFWNWICSIPFGGHVMHTPDKLPSSVRRCKDAQWLLNRAMADRKWFKECQRYIDEWYSWSWAPNKNGEKRKYSPGALVKNWMEQVTMAKNNIDEREKFRVMGLT